MSVDPEIEGLITELLAMGAEDPDKLSENATAYLREDKPRAREIGQRLNEIGGSVLMIEVYRVVAACHGPVLARHLEYAWDDVGGWAA